MMRGLVMCFLLVAAPRALAQEAVTPAGGDANSAQGSVSWTIGQVDHITITAPQGSVQQGVQQPYVDIGTAVSAPGPSVEFVLLPNPAQGDAVLRHSAHLDGIWTYTLIDAAGRTVSYGRLAGAHTPIHTAQLAPGAYALTVAHNGLPRTTLTLLKQ